MSERLPEHYMRFKIIALLCLVHTLTYAQLRREIYFEHTTNELGLSQNSIQSIIQDKTGYLWFGTGDGLNQFDGYKFTIFTRDPTNPKLLSSGNIQCLFRDHNNILWVGTDVGLNSYDPSTGKISHFLHDEKNGNSLSSDNVKAITEWNGFLWIGTADEGLCRLDVSKNTFTKCNCKENNPLSLPSNKISCFYAEPGKNGVLYIGTEDSGLCMLSTSALEFKRLKGFGSVNCIYPINGNLFIGTNQGLYVGTPGSGFKQYVHDDKNIYSLSNNQVTAITLGSRGEIWIGTNGGLNEFDAVLNTFNAYHHDVAHAFTLCDDRITCLFTDRSGKVWIGTFSGGVDAIDPPNVIFKSYRHEAGNVNSISYDDVSAIREDEGKNIWVGTLGGGLNLFDPVKQTFKSFRKTGLPGSLSSDYITCIYVDHNNVVWVGTQDAGLNSFDVREQKFKTYKKGNGPNSLPSNSILCLKEDLNNHLWIGTEDGGIAWLDVENKNIIPFKDKDNLASTLQKYQVRNLYADDNAEIMWIASLGGGLFEYNSKTQKLKNYVHSDKKNSLSNNKILSIFEDLNRRMWIGTDEGGLNLLNPDAGTFTFFSEHEGIPNNVINGILEDNFENLWLYTNKGICKFSPPTSVGSSKFIQGKVKVSKNNSYSSSGKGNESESINVRTYDSRDGLPTNQFNRGAYLKTIDGKMYIGSVLGLVTFEPDSVRDNPYIPPVVVTDFKLFNHSVVPNDSFNVLTKPIYETNEIHLKYNQNVLSFEFTALNYINPKHNRYSFKLEGFDLNWNDADATRRFATYTNLEPGDYTFRVKGSNNDGIWNEKGASIHIVISPPFWRTWWFRVFVLIVVGASVYFVIWFRLNQIRKTEEQKTEVNKLISEARLIALRAQMNPHFIFNSLNSIQQFIYNNDREEAATYLSKFSKLIRQILEHSSQGTILLQDEASILNLYLELEALRFQDKFSFDIDIDEDIDAGYTEIPSMLIQPYIENAILHGLVNKEGEGHISVSIHPDEHSENLLIVSIADNGIGREKAMEINKKKVFKYKNKSMGMSVTNDRLTILNQYQQQNIAVQIIDLKDEKGNALGTRVDIRIPVDEM